MSGYWRHLKKRNQVFISYAHKNQSAVDPIYTTLRRRGYNVWIDRQEGAIPPGERWENVLKAEVEMSYAMMVCLSSDYLASEWCTREWEYALELGKKLYTVRVQPVDYKTLPAALQTIQGAMLDDAARPADYTRELQGVIRQLRRPLIHYAVPLMFLFLLLSVGVIWWSSRPPGLPQPEEFVTVKSTFGFNVSHLALNSDGILWFVATADGQQSLYSLDTRMRDAEDAVINKEAAIPEAQVWDLLVDCAGNAWILVSDGFRIGDSERIAASDLTIWSLSTRTMYAATSRCQNNRTDIWMGRNGIYSLQYTSSPEQFEAVNPIQDPVHTALTDENANLGAVQKLLAANGILWVLDRENSQVISKQLDTSAGATAIRLESNDPLVDFALAPDGVMWVLSANDLFAILEGRIIQHETLPNSMNPTVLTVDNTWVWLGERCVTAACRPLTVFRAGSPSEIDLQQNSIHDIQYNQSYGLWIATENGVVFRKILF